MMPTSTSTTTTGHSSASVVIDDDDGGGDSGSGRGEDSQQLIAAVHNVKMLQSDVGGGVDETRQESLPQHHNIVDDHKLNCDQNNLCSDDDNDDFNFIGDIRHGDEETNAINEHCHDREDNDGIQQNGHLSLAGTSNGRPTLQSSQASQIDDAAESVKAEHHRMTRRRRRLVPAAVIESDASTAFSHYRPVPPLSTFITENNIAPENAGEPLSKKSTGKPSRRRGRRDKRDKKRNRNRRQCMDNDNMSGATSEDNIQIGNASVTLQTNSQQQQPQQPQHHDDNTITTKLHPNTTINTTDPMHSILPDDDDPILQEYLPQLKFLSVNYYSRVQPYRMGKRNLPLNQLELILRRRAVIKRSDARREQAISRANGLDREDVGKEGGGSKINSSPSISTIRKPPLPPPHSPPRRKLFPSTTQQHSPTRTHHKADYHDDGSTISSTTIASHLITPAPKQQPIESTLTSQQPIISSTSCDTAIAISSIPKEEVIGDTSLGLKLTIIQGKVIIQKITPLDDGRASPAQLCGLLSPGDVLIAVNGKSLINGTIHNPVSMDKIITVLKPLSQPMDVVTKEYSREVRLRFVLAEGKALLHEQEEREKQKKHERELRKKLGLDSGGGIGRGLDPAADLFGIGAFMGVDQHSGMPMFGNLERHHEEEKKNENNMESNDGILAANKVVAVASVPMEVSDATKATSTSLQSHPLPLLFAQARPTVQAQIAQQIHLDRQWLRHRNTSEFFTLSNNAPRLLRPPSPPIDHIKDLDADHSIDARKRRLERGAQIVTNATSLVSVVESQDNGIECFEDEDPMEVASRVCGTATVRTGASRRRWHRGDSVIAEEESSLAASNYDGGTIRSGESSVEACDHRFLVELAANNESWKMNVLKRLDAFARETEKENIESSHGKNNHGDSNTVREEAGSTGFDSFLFGGDVAKILGKQKQSMSLPPGEMTAMLFDLVELLESGLPNQIFTKDELSRTAASSFLNDKVVSFAKNDDNTDIAKATDFLLHQALGIWLKSFRPLPWKQRRALWPTHQSGLDGDSMISSRVDDDDSLSLTSGTTAQTRSPERHKRNLRELIEHLELDPETRRETCTLVTFFFTRKLRASVQTDITHNESRLPQSAEDEALTLIDAYGSYLNIHTCLVVAGRCHSKSIVAKLLNVARYDSQHKEAVKALERARTLLFYEPNMLSALLDLLPSITKLPSNNLDFITLLVSAYPDLQPWSVREATDSEQSSAFYSKYLLSLMHHEEGNDAAKRDEALVKEFCLMISSCNNADTSIGETYRRSFFHIASRDDPSSEHYHRDLAFLMHCSVKMSEFGLALSLANEIISSRRYFKDEQVLLHVLQHIGVISDKAIEGNGGEVNTIILGQVISFLSVFSSRMAERECVFDLGAELSKYVEKCYFKHKNNPQKHSSSSVDACITTISENAPPAYSLQILAQWEHACLDSSTFISAIHTSLISGARDGVRSELSGSLLRIQRSREEGRRPITENGMSSGSGGSAEDEVVEDGGFIWSRILEGTAEITK